jgi:glycosyltransferase involved in cell wall biosynthesis
MLGKIRLKSFLSSKRIKISIILPIYNAEDYLESCLDSIINQDFNGFEIIAVNDCSTDKSLQILNDYRRRHGMIKIVNHGINVGAGASRNEAVKIAKGKYIAFIDSDDKFGEKYLECLYDEAENTSAEIVFSNLMLVKHNKEIKHGGFQHVINKYYKTDITLKDLPYDCRLTAPWMKLFRRDFIINNDIKFLEGIRLGAEDIPFSWISYFLAKKISFCESSFYYYNLIPDSLDRHIGQNIIEIFEALSFTKIEYQRFDPEHIRRKQLDALFISHAYYQFQKIIQEDEINIELASMYWIESHGNLVDVIPENILENENLQDHEKEYYVDVMNHSSMDQEMKNKYLLDKDKLHNENA